jgi:hypothetical protein
MVALAKRIALFALVAFVAYKAIGFYVFYTFANSVVAQCTSLDEIASLKIRKASGTEVERFMHTTFSCVKEKQNLIQAHYFPVPDKWLNPPPGSVTYKDIPDL